jgi:hypothetical protein
MADQNANQAPVFDHNPEIAAQIENEKGEFERPNQSDSEGSTKAGEWPPPDTAPGGEKSTVREDEKIEIAEEDCYDELGYSYPSWKKWYPVYSPCFDDFIY